MLNHGLNPRAMTWLLEPGDPGVRYLAMRDLLDLPGDDPSLLEAQQRAHREGPLAEILDNIHEAGYWVESGPGYSPKYRGTVWSVIALAQLGASAAVDERIGLAGRYLLDHALTDHGQFSSSGKPSATADCLQGNLCAAMLDLGITDDRLDSAFAWMARTVTGEGVAPMGDKSTPLRYYSGKCGPDFLCGANNNQACAWGAVKVMLAFGKLPGQKRTPLIDRAIEKGAGFLLGPDPVEATYPSGWNDKPSKNWWKFGFPVFYVTDLLQNVEALVLLGYGRDERLSRAIEYIRDKQDSEGRWLLDYDYAGKTWGDFGEKKKANKWVTLRAARVLKSVGGWRIS